MSLRILRALFETQIHDYFQSLTPAVPVVFDNVQEEPPGTEYVIVSLSYPSFTEPVLCPTGESMIEFIRGTVQIACYTPRAQGMVRLEELQTTAMKALLQMNTNPLADTYAVGMNQILGPENVLAGDQPYALSNIACGFTARALTDQTVPFVTSLHGRTGDVVGAKNDYTLGQMSDVETDPSSSDQSLSWNGRKWVQSPSIDSGRY